MSKIWALTKVLIKTNFLSGTGDSKVNKKKNTHLAVIGVIVLFLFVFGSLGVPLIFAFDAILEIVDMHRLALAVIIPFAGIATIIFSVFSIVSVFYLSKDIEHLLPLPIKPKDILISKFFTSLINEYYILFMFVMPCLIGVGVGIDAGVLYYVYMILVFLLLPIIPSCIVTFIILLITKFTGVIKNKDLFMYISMGLVLIFAFAYNYIIQNVISLDINNIGSTLNSLEMELLPKLKIIFPFYNSAVSTLINYNSINGVFSFIAFLMFNVFAILFVYFFGEKLYLKALINTRGVKKNSENISELVSNKSNQNWFIWLLKKEWLIIKRTPIFMLNIVIIIFIMPLVIIFSFAITFMQEGVDMSLMVDSSVITSYLSNPFIYLGVIAGVLFFTSTSMSASTSISREGSSAWLMKVIPVSYFKQINVKVFFAVLLDMFGAAVAAIIPIVLYKIPLYYVICVSVPVLILVILLNYINIYLDLRKPKLKWTEESAAVKQNMNGLYSVLITMAVCGLFGILAYVFYKYIVNINVILLSFIICVVSGILLVLVVWLFYKNRNKLLDNVD